LSVPHYLVFIGASAALSTELITLSRRLPNIKLIAPAMPKAQCKISTASLENALMHCHAALAKETDHGETARFSVWSYLPTTAESITQIRDMFGVSAWIEFVPNTFLNKIKQTRLYIESRLKAVAPLLHLVSSAIFSCRKTSPLPLPLKNFRSPEAKKLMQFWYHDLNEDQLEKEISHLYVQHRRRRIDGQSSYKDDRALGRRLITP